MVYSYTEHVSDIGIVASAPTLEAAFEEGVKAALDVMFELPTVNETLGVEITASAPEIDLLFVEVLNEVLSIQGRDELALKRLETGEIRKAGGEYLFKGTAFGERLDLRRHGVKTEVKGATYSGLSYAVEKGGHTLRCVLDV